MFTPIVKIQVIKEGTTYQIQLDSIDKLTVESISNVISCAMGTNDKVLLCTDDNMILFPNIDFLSLFLINPNKYKTLKVYNSSPSSSITKKTSIESYKPKYLPDSTLPSKRALSTDFEPKSYSHYKTESNLMQNITQVSLKDKYNLKSNDELTTPKFTSISNYKTPSETNDLIKQNKMQIDKSYKPETTSTNVAESERNIKIGNNENNSNNNKMMDFRMDYKKFTPSFPSEYSSPKNTITNTGLLQKKFDMGDIQTSTSTNLNMKFTDTKANPLTSQYSGLSQRENKDLIGNVATANSNYMYNTQLSKQNNQSSPLLNVLNQQSNIPATQGVQSLSELNEQLGIKNSYGNFINNQHNLTETAQTTNKEDFGRFSTEKRNFRTPNITQVETNLNIDKYKPKEYQKFNQNNPLDDRFMNEKISGFNMKSGNFGLKPNQDENVGIGGKFAGEDNNMELRARLGSFGIENQRPQMELLNKYKEFEKFANLGDLGRNMEKK